MTSPLRYRALVLLAALCLSAGGYIALAQDTTALYLPIVQAQGTSVELVARVDIPFNTLPGVVPTAIQADSGAWLITVYRIDSGSADGAWIVRWREGAQVSAFPLDQGPQAESVEPIAGSMSDARGSLACGLDGRIWHFSWDSTRSSRRPTLVVYRLLGETCRRGP